MDQSPGHPDERVLHDILRDGAVLEEQVREANGCAGMP
jgi:hypothetical protein